MSGCFPVSQGQEKKDLTASTGSKQNNDHRIPTKQSFRKLSKISTSWVWVRIIRCVRLETHQPPYSSIRYHFVF